MKEEKLGSIKFDEIGFPRYIKIKESIESLMKIINFDKAKEHGLTKVLTAFLQLIDENDDKTVEEKYDDIKDAIYNGNVFRHYFSEENQSKAVDILSNTAILNDEERLVYIINFYMPNDVNFTNVYNSSEKNIDKIAEYYGLTSEDAYNLVYARAAEISKFYSMYKAEKERQKIFSKTQVLAAMQDATDNPTKENIKIVRDLLGGLTDDSLKDTLENQLLELEIDNIDVSGIPELKEVEEIELPLEEAEQSQEEPAIVPDDKIETEDVIADFEMKIEEPEPLDKVLEEETKKQELKSETNVGKEVMASLQSLVAGAKENAQRVEQLSLELEDRENKITELQATINAKDEEITDKNYELELKEQELKERDRTIEEQSARLVLLESEVAAKSSALDDASRLVADKDEKILSLTTSLNSYKTSLTEIQSFLSKAQPVVETAENTRKVA